MADLPLDGLTLLTPIPGAAEMYLVSAGLDYRGNVNDLVVGRTLSATIALGIRSSGAAFDLQLASSEVLTANRALNIVLGDAARTLTVGASASVSGANTGDQTTVSGNAGTATALATTRAIYGNNFNGTAALAQIIASTYGGTGNGFTKFSGPATAEKTFTLPDASATLARTDAGQTFTGVNTMTAPVFVTSAETPLIIGGTGTTSTLTLRPTSGVGTTGADIILQVGNNGATEVARFRFSGSVGFGVTAPSTLGGRVVEILGSTDNKLGGFIVTSTGAGVTTKSRFGSNFDGAKITQNATYNGSAWVADDTGKSTASILVNAAVSDGFVQIFTASTNDAGIGTERIRINKLGITNLFKGADVASAATIVPTGNNFTITGTTTISAISTTGILAGTVLHMITTSAGLVFDEAGNIDITNATSLTSTANGLVITVWDGTKWRMR